MPVHPAIIPTLRYRDAPAAIDFLCNAFGFERHAVYPNERDPAVIQHAQLVRNGQMIMLGTVIDNVHARNARALTPAEAGGCTMVLYLVIDDVDAHAAHAKAAGADVYEAPVDRDYGGRGYSARDPEGYVWSFGDYDPFA